MLRKLVYIHGMKNVNHMKRTRDINISDLLCLDKTIEVVCSL